VDATRTRRTKDRVRQAWYAVNRQRRFARRLGFGPESSGRADGSLQSGCFTNRSGSKVFPTNPMKKGNFGHVGR
jgi:hypothetical protein